MGHHQIIEWQIHSQIGKPNAGRGAFGKFQGKNGLKQQPIQPCGLFLFQILYVCNQRPAFLFEFQISKNFRIVEIRFLDQPLQITQDEKVHPVTLIDPIEILTGLRIRVRFKIFAHSFLRSLPELRPDIGIVAAIQGRRARLI